MNPHFTFRRRAEAARDSSDYDVGAAYVTDCTPDGLEGRVRRVRFVVAHNAGVDEVIGELHADDLVAYACPDYRLSTVTADDLAGALEGRAAGRPTTERGAWLHQVATTGEAVRLFPQDLGSRQRRARLRQTVFGV